MRALPVGVAVSALALSLFPLGAHHADAAAGDELRPLFEIPFPCGDTRQGATYAGHGGSGNHYPLDFNRGGGNDDLGDVVRASAGGRAQVWTESDGDRTIRIHHNSAWSTDYQHLSEFLIRDGSWVHPGEPIGKVGRSGTSSAHLHYEQRHDGVAASIHFHGKPLNPDYSFTYNGPSYTSRNCADPDNSLSAAPGADGRTQVFGRSGGGDVLWKTHVPGSGWSNWRNLGGNIIGNPDVTSRFAGQLELFARNGQSKLVNRSRPPGGEWSAWRQLSEFDLAYPPAAVAPDRDTILLFAVRAGDHAVVRRAWRAGEGWQPWVQISGGGYSSGPDVAVRPGGIVDLVVRGPDARVQHKRFVPGEGWKPWSSMPGSVTTMNGVAPAVASRAAGTVDVMVRDANGRLHQRIHRPDTGWGNWALIDELGTRFSHGPDLLAAGPRKAPRVRPRCHR
ncbi:MAG: peptidoglycan DD-metalloendopeptidase family protein [Micromonosporaceae bacterium]